MNDSMIITEDHAAKLGKRITEIQVQLKIRERETANALEEVSKLLEALDERTVDDLISICPDAILLRNLTVDSLQNDESLRHRLKDIISTLYTYLDRRLSELEELI